MTPLLKINKQTQRKKCRLPHFCGLNLFAWHSRLSFIRPSDLSDFLSALNALLYSTPLGHIHFPVSSPWLTMWVASPSYCSESRACFPRHSSNMFSLWSLLWLSDFTVGSFPWTSRTFTSEGLLWDNMLEIACMIQRWEKKSMSWALQLSTPHNTPK